VRTQRTVSTALALTVAVSALLSGCALFPQQTTVVACLQMKDALETVSTDMTDASADLVSDPDGAANKIAGIAAEFEAATAAISNAEVHEAAVKTSDALNEFSDLINDYADDPENADSAALSTSGENVGTQMLALGEVCA
jgi:hypothetical protein